MRALILAALLLAQALAGGAHAAAAEPRQYLLVLARDGAFAGNLWSLAGREVVIDDRQGAGAVAARLTSAHGWNDEDRRGWRAGGLADGARAVCVGRAAALVTLATAGDPALDRALAQCRFRLIDLGDNVTRAFAARNTDLSAASLPGNMGPDLSGATLTHRPRTEVAAER